MLRLFRIVFFDYIKSFRIGIEIGVAVLVPYLVLRNTLDSATILASWALLTLVMSAYTTSVLTDLADQPTHLWRLLGMRTRTAYLQAYLLSALSISVFTYVIIVLSTLVFNSFALPAWSTIIATWPALLMLMVTTIVVMGLFAPLITQTWQRLTVLILLTIPLAWNSVVRFVMFQRDGAPSLLLDSIATILGISIWPTLHLYALCVHPTYTWMSLLFFGIQAAVIIGGMSVTRILFERKFIRITH